MSIMANMSELQEFKVSTLFSSTEDDDLNYYGYSKGYAGH